MQPLNDFDGSRTQYVAAHVRNDLQRPKSGEHIARLAMACALLICGLGVVISKVFIAVSTKVQAVWTRDDLVLVLSLVGVAFSIAFTGTFLSVMRIVWPWGAKHGRGTGSGN